MTVMPTLPRQSQLLVLPLAASAPSSASESKAESTRRISPTTTPGRTVGQLSVRILGRPRPLGPAVGSVRHDLRQRRLSQRHGGDRCGRYRIPQKECVRSPITLGIENGYICSIEGGVAAMLLTATLDAYANPEVFAVSHLGWGLSRSSRWDSLAFYDKKDIEGQDGRGHYGNFLFPTGPNLSGGGTRGAPLHLYIPPHDASVWLDHRQMVKTGEVLAPEQKVQPEVPDNGLALLGSWASGRWVACHLP